MRPQELMQVLTTPIDPSESWLQNQYPARPSARYSDRTYLNYQNLADCFGSIVKENVIRLLREHPEIKIVIVAELTPRGNPRKQPTIFVDPESDYYGNYELFACAFHLAGFIEVFHNFKKAGATKI